MFKFLILLLLSFNLCAESIMIERSLYTNHFAGNYNYNEKNDMIAVEYSTNNWYLNASSFYNSFYKDSVSIGSGYKYYSKYNFNLDLLFGAVTNYNDIDADVKIIIPCIGSVCFYVSPRISYDLALTDSISIVPSAKVFGSAVVFGVGAKYKF